ncbi:MAG: hypothetical protein PHV45_05440, partial [Desulfuromonas thiophila]|nr:hypothetical protein [Desulfuromonas thiophila]
MHEKISFVGEALRPWLRGGFGPSRRPLWGVEPARLRMVTQSDAGGQRRKHPGVAKKKAGAVAGTDQKKKEVWKEFCCFVDGR